jgi:hypothetical protein
VRQVLVVIGFCLLVVLSLPLISRGHDSTTSAGLERLSLLEGGSHPFVPAVIPSPTPSTAEECSNLAQFWEDVPGRGVEDVAIVSRCRLAADGGWFQAAGEIPAGSSNSTLGRSIQAQLHDFYTSLPRSVRSAILNGHDPVMGPGTNRNEEGRNFLETNRAYAAALQPYLEHPAYSDLEGYVAWLVERHDGAMTAFLRGCEAHPRMSGVCRLVAESVRRDWVPWPWDLSDAGLLAEYLAQVPVPIWTP